MTAQIMANKIDSVINQVDHKPMFPQLCVPIHEPYVGYPYVLCTERHILNALVVSWIPTETGIIPDLTKHKWVVTFSWCHQRRYQSNPDSKVPGANVGPIWGRQDPGGPHVGPMNFAIWEPMTLFLQMCILLLLLFDIFMVLLIAHLCLSTNVASQHI